MFVTNLNVDSFAVNQKIIVEFIDVIYRNDMVDNISRFIGIKFDVNYSKFIFHD